MAKRISIGLVILVIGLVLIWAVDYLALFKFSQRSNTSSIPQNTFTVESDEQNSLSSVPFKVEVVAEDLTVPWSVVFTNENRILVSERTGSIKEVINGLVSDEPLHTFTDTARGSEIGLMALTLDPDYQNNKLLYACVGYKTEDGFADKVVQLKDNSSNLEQISIILDGIPAASNHAGCELAFGPDAKLYISTGDATERDIAQDINSLGGKILRINSDGTIPSDNPFPNSAIFTYGHRNPQGFDWTSAGILYEAEHGPSGNDGPGGGDEINILTVGSNYGWPLVSHDKTREGTESPLILYTPAEAPSSLLVYKGDVFPQFKDTLFVAALRGQGILWLQIDPENPKRVISSQKLEEVKVGRVRDITEGPDGLIYFTSSNTDGRGRPTKNDDKIYRLSPVET